MAENTEVDIENPMLGKLKISGQTAGTIVSVLILVLVSLIAYLLWEHRAEAKTTDQSIERVFEKWVEVQNETNRLHRQTNCLIGYQGPPANKKDFCEQVTR